MKYVKEKGRDYMKIEGKGNTSQSDQRRKGTSNGKIEGNEKHNYYVRAHFVWREK